MIRFLFCTIAAAALLTACSSQGVKGEAPFMQVTSWYMDGPILNASLRIRNVNTEDLAINSIAMAVQLDGTKLIDYQGQHLLVIPANGFETVDIQAPSTLEGSDLLVLLNNGVKKSLPYTMQSSVVSERHGRMETTRDGHLYTVPGKPGYYR